MQAHILLLHTPLTPWVVSKVKSFLSESSHVAYQINGNGAQSTMQAYSVLTHALDPWGEVKRSNMFLLKVVMLHIKSNGMAHRAPCKHKLCPYTHPQHPDGVKRSKLFSGSSHVAYQIKGNVA